MRRAFVTDAEYVLRTARAYLPQQSDMALIVLNSLLRRTHDPRLRHRVATIIGFIKIHQDTIADRWLKTTLDYELRRRGIIPLPDKRAAD